MRFFMLLLAIDATHGRRVSQQAIEAYILAAISTNAILALLDTLPRRLDRAHFVDLTIHPCRGNVRQRIGDRFVALVRAPRLGEIGKMLLAILPEFMTYFIDQLLVTRFQRRFELFLLFCRECHDLSL